MWPFSKKKNYQVQKEYTLESPEVDRRFVEDAVSFFGGYLSLCQKHSVLGISAVFRQEDDQFQIKTRMQCSIVAIDNEHAEEAFSYLNFYCKFVIEKRIAEADATLDVYDRYKISSDAHDEIVQEYFGCEDLHWVFTEIDNYSYEDNGHTAIISYAIPLWINNGQQWNATLLVLKQEILRRWPNAEIEIGKYGMTVKAGNA